MTSPRRLYSVSGDSRRLPLVICCLAAALSAQTELAAQTVAELSIQPVQVRLKVGEATELVASAMDRSGELIPNADYSWSSSNPGVITVREEQGFEGLGVVTAVGPGLALLEVRAGNLVTSIPVMVQEEAAITVEEQRPEEARPKPTAEAVPPPTSPPPAAAPGDTILSDRVFDYVRRVVLKLRSHRFAAQPMCFTGTVVGSPGLILTTYGAIRGASRLDGFRGGRMLRAIDVAAYDVENDLAVLSARGIPQRDSLQVADRVEEHQVVWGFGYPDCSVVRTGRFHVTRNPMDPARLVRLSRPIRGSTVGAPLITSGGDIAAIAANPRDAVMGPVAAALIAVARRNVEQNAVMTPAEVARRENHAFGALRIRAPYAGQTVRVRPLESWHAPGDGRAGTLPFNFRGPMGRYEIQLVVEGEVREARTVEVVPGEVTRVVLGEN